MEFSFFLPLGCLGLICLGPFPALGFFNQFHLLKGKIKEREHFKVESKGKKKKSKDYFGNSLAVQWLGLDFQ